MGRCLQLIYCLLRFLHFAVFKWHTTKSEQNFLALVDKYKTENVLRDKAQQQGGSLVCYLLTDSYRAVNCVSIRVYMYSKLPK